MYVYSLDFYTNPTGDHDDGDDDRWQEFANNLHAVFPQFRANKTCRMRVVRSLNYTWEEHYELWHIVYN